MKHDAHAEMVSARPVVQCAGWISNGSGIAERRPPFNEPICKAQDSVLFQAGVAQAGNCQQVFRRLILCNFSQRAIALRKNMKALQIATLLEMEEAASRRNEIEDALEITLAREAGD